MIRVIFIPAPDASLPANATLRERLALLVWRGLYATDPELAETLERRASADALGIAPEDFAEADA